MPIGIPGCPEFAASTASMARARIAFAHALKDAANSLPSDLFGAAFATHGRIRQPSVAHIAHVAAPGIGARAATLPKRAPESRSIRAASRAKTAMIDVQRQAEWQFGQLLSQPGAQGL